MEYREKMMNENASKSGVVAAGKRNPNKEPELNDAPTGPYSHMMGYEGDSGMHGDVNVSGKNGMKFHFK